ncbi:unnamed protein product [Fusarium venenatum]|uniref:Uncharacterized protein n=1 Tax=Fusarium venenatum TaxID=56646 RepID=A0A2L2TDB8_9HYPO|nr:uncharacterized protein FVRRES_07857 [Fusarium venenatum]CEI63421.1 unnamed protein product [Fusarium venenatum]
MPSFLSILFGGSCGMPCRFDSSPKLLKLSANRDKTSEEWEKTGFALANFDRLKIGEPWWDYISRQVGVKPSNWCLQRFTESMQTVAFAAVKTEEPLITGYDWSSLSEGTVVGAGGSSGHDAACLPRPFLNLRIIV